MNDLLSSTIIIFFKGPAAERVMVTYDPQTDKLQIKQITKFDEMMERLGCQLCMYVYMCMYCMYVYLYVYMYVFIPIFLIFSCFCNTYVQYICMYVY